MDAFGIAMGTCCGLSGLAFGAAWLLRRSLRRLAKGLMSAANTSPPRIRLQPAGPDLAVSSALVDASAALVARGFHPAGRFVVSELGDVVIEGFVGPGDGATSDCLAAVYDHPLVPTWVDIVEQDQAGTDRTVTSGKRQVGLAQPSWRVAEYLEGAAVDALVDAFDAGRLSLPRRQVDRAHFAALFEQAWAREQDWRNARGGPSREEVFVVGGSKHTPQVVEEAWRLQHSAAIAGLQVAFLEQLRPLPDDAGEGEFLFVHDVMDADDLAELLEDGLGLGDVELPDLPARQAFPQAITKLPERFRPRRFTQLDTPVACDVYRLAMDPPQA